MKQPIKTTKPNQSETQNFGEFISGTATLPASAFTDRNLSQVRKLIIALIMVGLAAVTAITLRPLLTRPISAPTPAGSVIIPGSSSSDLPLQPAETTQHYQGTVGTDPVSR